jgi:HTH-type transcriptional regulator, sugar sensing transcriptional regulator
LSGSNDLNEQVLTLTELGLSTTQAKIYLALVKTKSQTAQAISVLSTVSRPDVYRVLNQLQEVGLVEKIIAKPEEFRAIPIEEGVSILLQRRITKTRELQNRSLKLVQSVNQKLESSEATEEQGRREFVFIPSKNSAYARSERLLRGIQESLYFVGLTKSMSAWLTQYSPEMEAALSRGIDCRMILPASPANKKFWAPFEKMRKYPNFKVRSISGAPTAGFSIWDKKEILITTTYADTPLSAATLWSNNKGLIELCADYFECLWQKTKAIRTTQ